MRKKTLRDVDVSGKKVLLRLDLNVPLDASGRVADDTRIRASLPTLRYLIEHGAAVIAISHLGRPKGREVASLRLKPVAERLSELLALEVRTVGSVRGEEVERASATLRPGEVLLLENLRFEPGEEENDPAFSEALASLADLYVNDAFGAAHRAHASVSGVAERLPAVAGLLMESELAVLQDLLTSPARPFVTVLGGSKISDKLKVIGSLLEIADTLLLGGGMCFTALKSQGMEIGDSLYEEALLAEVAALMERSGRGRAEIVLPGDLVVAREFKADAERRIVPAAEIPAGWMGLDIGPRSIDAYVEAIKRARTIFWNGPMGVFEWEPFSAGTRAVAEAIAASGAVTVAGGGDTVAAIERYGLGDSFTHISTGGGASMELLEGRPLPGVEALDDAES